MKGTDSSPVVSYSLVNIKAWSRGARRVMGRVSRSRHSRSVPRVRISYSNSSWFKWRRLGTSEGELQQLSWETFGDYCSFGGFQYFPREILSVEPIYFKGASLYHYPIVRFTETCLTFSSQVHFYPPLSDPFNPKVLKRISEILWLKREFRPVLFYSSLPP